MKYINEEEKFWAHSYLVYLHELSDELLVNANSEQDAIDEAIDYSEEQGWMGLFLDDEDIQELEAEGYLEEHMCGGNHCLYLSSLNVHVKKID